MSKEDADAAVIADLAPDDPRWVEALPVLRELRTHLTDGLLTRILKDSEREGLRFSAVFRGERCVAVAGWRVMNNTSSIRELYVDDLSTGADDRSKGYGDLLLRYLVERGRELGCRQLELDSGVQRFAAHRFYLRERMEIVAHHFALRLS